MTRWSLVIPDETNLSVRRYLAHTGGKKGDLSKFVDQAVRAEILRRSVCDIQEQNSDLSPEKAQALADEAVVWARANRS
ncbi:MAG: ribbon-helix-helix domain-containing protein [Candidatus Hydrogenedentes bacterium]|nr:ribbon-helix-helix domain-containing protein [Candidatus Hydrogenedentota bacterium]